MFVTKELLFLHNTSITFCPKCPDVSRPLSLKAILKWYRAVFWEEVISYEWGEIYLSGHVSFGIKNNYYRISLGLHSWIKVIHRLQFILLFKIPSEIFKFIKLRLHQQGKGREVVSMPNNQSWIFNRCLFAVSGGEIDGCMSLFALKGCCLVFRITESMHQGYISTLYKYTYKHM